jgi:hypothetical protein
MVLMASYLVNHFFLFEAFVGGSRYCTVVTQGRYQTTVLPFAYETDVEATITQQLLQSRLLHIAALQYTY